MKVEIVQTNEITSYVGIRAISLMTDLGNAVSHALKELNERSTEIRNIKNHQNTYGITPPNYKGNNGLLDFYCCHEVDPLANVPQGMIHIHLLPRMYSVTHYKGPASKSYTAYDFTSKWMQENGFEYDEKTIRDIEDDRNEITIYCPIKNKGDQLYG